VKRFSRRWASVGVIVSPGQRRCRDRGDRRNSQELREHPGLRPAPGYEVIRSLGAIRRAVLCQGLEEGPSDLLDHERAERSPEMVSQADSCLSRGRRWRSSPDIAQGTSIAIEKKFAKAGGSSIDYDRQVVGGIAKVYVSFDGKAVGAAQAKGVVKALGSKVEARRRRALGRPDGSERVSGSRAATTPF